MGQLDAQQRGLQPVEALVVAELHVLALGALAEVAQPAQTRGQHGVVGADRTAVPERAEVLARIERERAGVAERAGAAAAERRPVGLRGVLQQEQTVSSASSSSASMSHIWP